MLSDQHFTAHLYSHFKLSILSQCIDAIRDPDLSVGRSGLAAARFRASVFSELKYLNFCKELTSANQGLSFGL